MKRTLLHASTALPLAVVFLLGTTDSAPEMRSCAHPDAGSAAARGAPAPKREHPPQPIIARLGPREARGDDAAGAIREGVERAPAVPHLPQPPLVLASPVPAAAERVPLGPNPVSVRHLPHVLPFALAPPA